MADHRNKETNFDIDLLPFISLLAVLISFLLLTAVWINIGTMDISQAFGPQRSAEEVKEPQVQINILDYGKFEIQIKDLQDKRDLKFQVANSNKDSSKEKLESLLERIGTDYPEVKTALIAPTNKTSYEDLVFVMDAIKKANISSIGVIPL